MWPSVACVGETSEHPLADPIAVTCVDEDGDGYGEGCEPGPDCDDGDPAHHDDCPRPLSKPVAKIECDEGAVEDCKVILGTHNGVTDCFVGIRKCVSGAWSICGGAS